MTRGYSRNLVFHLGSGAKKFALQLPLGVNTICFPSHMNSIQNSKRRKVWYSRFISVAY